MDVHVPVQLCCRREVVYCSVIVARSLCVGESTYVLGISLTAAAGAVPDSVAGADDATCIALAPSLVHAAWFMLGKSRPQPPPACAYAPNPNQFCWQLHLRAYGLIKMAAWTC